MKKIMSLILAVLCVTLAALPLSVSAEVAENTKTVYADDIQMAIQSGTTGGNASSSYEITSNGLEIAQAMKFPAVLYHDISKWSDNTLTDYSITLKMTTTVPTTNYWLMLGYVKGTLSPIDSSSNFSAITNRIGICVKDASLTIKNWNDGTEVAYTSEDDDVIADAIRNGTEMTYTLEVKSSVLASISISNETISNTYSFDYDGTASDIEKVNGITITNDYFGYSWGYAWNDNTGSGSSAKYINSTLESIDVSIGENSVYSLDYADLANCRSTVIGGQLSDDNTTVRILSAITMEDTELANYASHGFEISRKGSDKGAQTRTSTKVYTSVSAAGDTVTAGDEKCDFIGAMTVTGLAAGESYTFVVRAFVTDAAGNKYMSAAEEITIDVPES